MFHGLTSGKETILTVKEAAGASKTGVVFNRDWTKGSIIRNLLSISWPMIVTEGSWGLGIGLDMIWLGKLGTAAIAGVGVAFIILMVGVALYMGIAISAMAMVARFVGAGDDSGATHVARQAFALMIVFSIVVMVTGFFFAEPLLSLFGLEADVVASGVAYLRIIFLGWIALALLDLSLRIMQGSGDSVRPMKVLVFMMSLHMLLSPLLTLGWWVFPRLGVSGTALTFVISHGVGTSILLWIFFTGRTRLRLTMSNFRLDFDILWRLVKIGLPAAVMGTQRTFGNLALVWLIIPFGTLAVAAHSLVERIELIVRLPSGGLGFGAGVLVGQNLGADQPERAERSGWRGVALVEVFAVICLVVILLWASNIIGIFNLEPGLMELGGTFLQIAVAGYLALALNFVLQRCLTGAGDTLTPMLVSLLMLWVVQIPLAVLLPRFTDLGVFGVRWAMVAGLLTGAVAYTIYFRLGRWKRKKV